MRREPAGAPATAQDEPLRGGFRPSVKAADDADAGHRTSRVRGTRRSSPLPGPAHPDPARLSRRTRSPPSARRHRLHLLLRVSLRERARAVGDRVGVECARRPPRGAAHGDPGRHVVRRSRRSGGVRDRATAPRQRGRGRADARAAAQRRPHALSLAAVRREGERRSRWRPAIARALRHDGPGCRRGPHRPSRARRSVAGCVPARDRRPLRRSCAHGRGSGRRTAGSGAPRGGARAAAARERACAAVRAPAGEPGCGRGRRAGPGRPRLGRQPQRRCAGGPRRGAAHVVVERGFHHQRGRWQAIAGRRFDTCRTPRSLPGLVGGLHGRGRARPPGTGRGHRAPPARTSERHAGRSGNPVRLRRHRGQRGAGRVRLDARRDSARRRVPVAGGGRAMPEQAS